MIVACPKCGRKYSVPDEKLSEGARRLRCRNCSEVFTVEPVAAAPKESHEPEEETPAVRARRLARVLASDMVVYNKDLVETARREGNLPEVLSGEIERSWQLWKSRYPNESREMPEIFREAMNDILAGGRPAFDDWAPESQA